MPSESDEVCGFVWGGISNADYIYESKKKNSLTILLHLCLLSDQGEEKAMINRKEDNLYLII